MEAGGATGSGGGAAADGGRGGHGGRGGAAAVAPATAGTAGSSGTGGTIAEPAGLIAYWRFNEGSGTTVADSSGNGQTLTLSSSGRDLDHRRSRRAGLDVRRRDRRRRA